MESLIIPMNDKKMVIEKMKIKDILRDDAIILELNANNKRDVIREISIVLSHSSGVGKREIRVLMERESLGTTGIGDGVAIPHARCKGLDRIYGCLAKSTYGVDFDSIDGEKAHLIFGLISPTNSTSNYLNAIVRISRLLKNRDLQKKLIKANDGKTLMRLLVIEDEKLGGL